MAEKIVSPGVFTRENDLSFLQQGVADIGAAFIGPFKEGPNVPTIVNSQAEFQTIFGSVDDTYYTPLAVQSYLREAGVATICRVTGIGGYKAQNPILLNQTEGAVTKSLAILFPSDKNTFSTGLSLVAGNAPGFSGSGSALLGYGDFTLAITASTAAAAFNGTSSLDPDDINNVESVFGTQAIAKKGAYVYAFWKNSGFAFGANTTASMTLLGDQDFGFDAKEGRTPYVTSQTISGETYKLFQIETFGVGDSANEKVKVSITNIKPAGTVAGSNYGSFTVLVRSFGDTDKRKSILETFSGVNLDPNSANYIYRVIGDRYRETNNAGKITEYGDWVNNSKYIRLVSVDRDPTLAPNLIPVQAVPFGHAAYLLPISCSSQIGELIPTASFVKATTSVFGGIDLDNNGGDNTLYMNPIPNGAGSGANIAFTLETYYSLTGSLAADVAVRNFTVAFQEGFDGMSPTIPNYKGSDIIAGNTQGFDLTTSTASGSVAYAKHINALSNADEWDINMVVAPGVIQRLHSSTTDSLIDMVESRSDAFYIMDSTAYGDSIEQAVVQAQLVDTNYAASYYPWVKTIDVNTNKLISVPPSVLLPGVFASNDRVAAEWFAPAGLNRGGLVGAVSVLNRLTHAERDTLYEGKVNPIAQFPGTGIVVFGQKTLQNKPSALDRINVRRLLLTVRKYIASTSKYLIFEQNTAVTRNKFLNIANPYLEAIQQRQGLYAFKVVMDESNNTPDVIDRNFLKGAIYLQPTKTAEFIQIDFNILPTGAAFGG
jgi:hypothetical protein